MPLVDDRLACGLAAAAVALLLVALAVAITGGVSIQLGGLLLRSHDPIRPLVAALLLLGIAAWWRGAATVASALDWQWLVVERHASLVAVALSLLAILAAFHWGAFIAGGSDSYCYLNQAELLARGAVHDYEPLSEDPTWPGNTWSFAPAGHIPMGAPAPALVPICPAGYPLLMAGMRLVAGRNAMFWITPLLGGVAVYLSFLLGRRLAGPAAGVLAAALTLSSPTFLFQLFQPMNDVMAAALWCAALVAAIDDRRRDLVRAGLAGLLTAAALTVRPNLLPLAVATGLGLSLVLPGRTFRQRLVIVAVFGLAAMPGAAIVMGIQNAMYGSPLRSGYGDLETMFSAAHVLPNLQRYSRWVIEAQTPFIAAALASPWVLAEPQTRRYAVLLLTFAAVTLACYLPYVVFDAWWYTRFLLPATLPLLALTAAVAVTLIRGMSRGRSVRPILFGLLTTALVAFSIRTAIARDVFRIRDLEWRFRSAGERVAALPSNAALITLHHSGSVRFYAGRSTLGWADIERGRLDDAIAFLRRHGRKPYLMFESWEEPQFKERFTGERLGALDWPPFAEIDGVRLYDPDDYDRQRHGETIATERVVTVKR